jgi:transposase
MGDDWAEDHHDVEIQDQNGRRLSKSLPEGLAGVARLHELIAEHLPATDEAVGIVDDGRVGGDVGTEAEAGPGQVLIGIETDRGPWVQALVAAGYRVYPINPRQVARYRERRANAGAKSDARDAHTLADMVRTDGHQLRPMAGDSPAA